MKDTLMPEYDLKEFIKACDNGEVGVDTDPKKDASEQLGLHTDEDILNFVAEKGAELEYVNTLPWRTFFKKTGKVVLIDGYNFFEKKKKYYLGFIKNLAGKWRIKSLHIDDNELVNKPFGSLKDFEIKKGDNDD